EGRHQSQGETDAVVAGKHRAHEASRRVALERAERRGSHDEREEAHGAEPDGDGGEGQVAHGATIGPTLAAATSHFKLTPAPATSSIEACALCWRGWRLWPWPAQPGPARHSWARATPSSHASTRNPRRST